MERTILHCDMNGFYASVELLFRPDLVGKPMAVCGNPTNRHGIILAKNEEAKAYGIVTAETVWQAKRKCPRLELVSPHHDWYQVYSHKINSIYLQYTDMVEPFSIDESWLDVTGSLQLFGTGEEIADAIRHQVKTELGLTLSVGVSFNKVFAKMGSEYKKPDATTVINGTNFKKVLWPLPVSELFFVGKVTAEKLMAMGITTIGDLAQAEEPLLRSLIGKQGSVLHQYANGWENEPVALYTERPTMKSVGNGMTFCRDLVGLGDIKTAVSSLSDTVSGRLRKYGMKCNGVKVDIKDPHFKTISRQKQLEQPTNLGEEIGKTAIRLIEKNWSMTEPIRLLTITGIQLCEEQGAEQLSLFVSQNEKREKQERVERALDTIREKYGGSAITFGGLVKNDIGIEILKEEEHEEK